LLRSEDDKVRRDAARELVRHAAPRTPVADRPRPPRLPWMLDNCDPGPPDGPDSQMPERRNEPVSDGTSRTGDGRTTTMPASPEGRREANAGAVPNIPSDAKGGATVAPGRSKGFSPKAWGLPWAKPTTAAG
jgi:hypothetical protein